MKNVLTIIKKELVRIFTDKKLLFTLLMPGLLIFVLYSIMGDAIMGKFGVEDDYEYKVCIVNESELLDDKIDEAIKQAGVNVKKEAKENSELEDLKNKVKEKEIDLVIYFDPNFDSMYEENLANGTTSIISGPNVELYYNSSKTESSSIYSNYKGILDAIEDSMSSIYNVNFDAEKQFDLATQEDITASMATMLLPFLIVMLLFSGCMAIVPESIAGEKERGTIATLLITPLKRRELAIGKITSLSIVSMCSALSSFIGVMASLPKLMSGIETSGVYGIKEYLFVLAILVVTVLLFVTLLSLVSAQSRSIKEASMYATPLMIIVMLVGILMMFGSNDVNTLMYLIPVYNSAQVLYSIFALDISVVGVIITIASNIVYTGLGIYLLTKMFNSEKIMYNK